MKGEASTHIDRSNRHSDILNHPSFTRGARITHPIPFIPPGHMLMRLFRYSSLVRLTCRLLVIAFKRGKNRLNIWVLRARAHLGYRWSLRGPTNKDRKKYSQRPTHVGWWWQSVKIQHLTKKGNVLQFVWLVVISFVKKTNVERTKNENCLRNQNLTYLPSSTGQWIVNTINHLNYLKF